MPRFSSNHVPGYRLHKRSGQAVVTIAGRDHYLGAYDSAASREAYNRLIAQWFASGRSAAAFHARQDTAALPTGPSVAQVIAAFWTHAQTYYRDKDGNPTSEIENLRNELRLLRRLYGSTPAAEFDTRALEACRSEMIRQGITRKSINRRVNRIRYVFKWSASQKLVPSTVSAELRELAGLKLGRTDAKETPPVKPVAESHVREAIKHASPHVAAMIELQLVTGMRSGEMLIMRTGDIDRTGAVWVYTPQKHKTEHLGHTRTVYLGARAQEIITPFLKLDPGAYVFSPADAEAERRAALASQRRTPLSCGNRPGTNKRAKPKRAPGARYVDTSYAHAIYKACDRAFPAPDTMTDPDEIKAWRKAHRFHPHQLRHTAATKFRRESGSIETARVLLGHKRLATTEIYAEQDVERAMKFVAGIS